MNAPDKRAVFVWRGKPDDRARLAETIASTIELFDEGGRLVRIGNDGKPAMVNFAEFKRLVGEHICGVRIRGGQREYYTYQFETRPRPGPPTWENQHPDKGLEREPWAQDIDAIFRDEILWRLPKVIP